MIAKKHRQPRDSRIHSEEKLPALDPQKQFVSIGAKSYTECSSKLYTERNDSDGNSTLIQQLQARRAKIKFMKENIKYSNVTPEIRLKISQDKAELRQIQMKQKTLDWLSDIFIRRRRSLDARKDKGRVDQLYQRLKEETDERQKEHIAECNQLVKKKDEVQNSIAANKLLFKNLAKLQVDQRVRFHRELSPITWHMKSNRPPQKSIFSILSLQK